MSNGGHERYKQLASLAELASQTFRASAIPNNGTKILSLTMSECWKFFGILHPKDTHEVVTEVIRREPAEYGAYIEYSRVYRRQFCETCQVAGVVWPRVIVSDVY